MAFPSYTYTFTNGSTSDATQVNQNFSDILNGISDTTKDISISALTTAGTSTLNGNVSLGNSSVKTVAFNGSLTTSIPVSATYTYDFGSSTFGMKSFYVSSSGGFSTRLMSAASANYTFTFPAAVGTAGSWLITDGSGNSSFTRGLTIQSKTTTYTALVSDDVVLADTSIAAWTLTIYTPVANTGYKLIVKKTSTDLSALTISPIAGNIEGSASTTLNTQYESIVLVSDGTNWQILERKTRTAPVGYTPTFSASLNSPPSVGVFSYRDGKYLCLFGGWTNGAATTGASASFSLGFNGVNTPTGLTMDSTFVPTSPNSILGHWGSTNVAADGGFILGTANTNTVLLLGIIAAGQIYGNGVNGNVIGNNTVLRFGLVKVPITGWND